MCHDEAEIHGVIRFEETVIESITPKSILELFMNSIIFSAAILGGISSLIHFLGKCLINIQRDTISTLKRMYSYVSFITRFRKCII